MKTYEDALSKFWYSDRHVNFSYRMHVENKPLPEWVNHATGAKLGMEINMAMEQPTQTIFKYYN